ncbi:MAG: PA0069 family radical SAM protein, partial [Myxococcota bacterium]|nr:PA0069 family radical SAM protein [Myxococcota bacterium]
MASPKNEPGPSFIRRVHNPPNPWSSLEVEWDELPPQVEVEVFEDQSRAVLSRNDSPDVPFRWSLNPYRGCYHACAYCYARPGHQYLGLGAGTDFDRKLMVKPRAAALLREAFEKKSWRGETIAFSGVTDCYQPLEASYGLTRACLEVCLEYHQPVSLITKSSLVERDIDLLRELNQVASCQVVLSVPFFDAETARAIEPGAPSPARRLKTIRTLAEAGIPVGVNVAPIIPGLSDMDIPAILEGAREAGATFAGHILVRLPSEVRQVFEARLQEKLPLRARRVMTQLSECRSGPSAETTFGQRMTGSGARWDVIESLYRATFTRLGFKPAHEGIRRDTFQ